MKKRTKKEMLMYFTYLDDLRESGITNMYGASPYLAEEFGLGEAEARAILIEWMLRPRPCGRRRHARTR